MRTNPNESAYPYIVRDDPNVPADVREGLTKREEFAKAAMQGICANPEAWSVYNHGNLTRPEYVALLAVEQADALIAALNENAHGVDEDYEAARADQ